MILKTIYNIISSVDFWKVVFPTLVAIAVWYLNEKSKLYWEKWKLKREACIKSLDIANAVLSTYKYPNIKPENIVEEKVDTAEARRCFNLLACTCDDTEILDVFKKILFGSVSPDIIVDLRNAVRKELNFGKKVIDNDREKAFIGKLGADPKAKK